MKKILFLIILTFISSCGKSTYYAFEQNGDYCTLEITKNNDILYRAVSSQYHDLGHRYVYISGYDEYHSTSYKIFDFYSLYSLRTNDDKFEVCGSAGDLDNLDERSFIVYSKATKDSLDLLWTPCIRANLLKEDCFKKNSMDWFAPYMKRVKKIDFKKFKLPQIKTRYLKSPEKALRMSG